MSESKLVEMLLNDGNQQSVDGSLTALDAVSVILEMHPGADKQALCLLANMLTKPAIDQPNKNKPTIYMVENSDERDRPYTDL